MNRIMAVFAAVSAAAMPATQAGAAERRYSVTDFDRIVVEGPFTVRLATGRSPAATATGSAQAIDRVSVEVQGRTLRIRANRSAWGGYPGVAAGPVAIQVSTHELRSAMVAGPGSLAIDRAEGLRVDLSVEGAGRIAAAGVDVDNLILGVIGSGRIQIAGTAKELRASVHGWADLDASGLTAQGANITTDSAGRVAVAVVREARVTASGLGEVEIIGSPACTLSGLTASEVRCGDAGRR